MNTTDARTANPDSSPVPASPGQARAAVDAALAAGHVAIVPVEGTYAAVAPADSPVWAGLPQRAASPAQVWLAPDAEALVAALGPAAAPTHKRLVRRLLPGPLEVARNAEGAGPVAAGFAIDGLGGRDRRIGRARVTAHATTSAIVAAHRSPLVAIELLRAGAPITDAAHAAALATEIGLRPGAGAIIAEPPRDRALATIAILTGDGGVEISRAGGYEERFIRKQLALNVLFVCTGNTCRSPMSEAIATALRGTALPGGDSADPSLTLRFSSAGTAASSGGGASGEAVEAVRGLGIGANLSAHRSRPLTRRLIAEADVIFTMGRSHLYAVLDLDPEAADKSKLLDPDGRDVPDPVGMPLEAYQLAARRLMDMIRRRLKEIA